MLKKNVLLMFTDGSINRDTGMCSSACIGVAKHKVFLSKVTSCIGTNQVGEVHAMYNAVVSAGEFIDKFDSEGAAFEYDEIWFISDSRYVVQSINEYSKKWIEQGWDNTWIGSTKQAIAHQDKFKEILRLRDKYTGLFKFMHIYSHLKGDDAIATAHKRFNDYNKVDINRVTFDDFVRCNEIVDKLAYKEINTSNQ